MLTIGEILKKEREDKKLILEDIEKGTKIRKKNLEAIEKNEWEKFSSKTYIIGVIKTYGRFLNINQEKLLAVFRREYEKKEEINFKKKIDKKYITPVKQVFRFLIFLVVFIFIIYFSWQLKMYLTPPKVEILNPKESVFKKTDKIELVGKTEKEAIITVNNEKVYPNKDGVFKISIPLNMPSNEVIVEVTGANGRKTIIKKVFKKND